ncbi:MAG: hypothetical protein HFG97_08625 [Dorea sp.]|nr:hypothetical protein [Dorea sp.]
MKKKGLYILSSIALHAAMTSLLNCSTWGGHQPQLEESLKVKINSVRGELHERV